MSTHCSPPTSKDGYTITTAEVPATIDLGQFQKGTALPGITCDSDEGYSGAPLAYCETEGQTYGLTGCSRSSGPGQRCVVKGEGEAVAERALVLEPDGGTPWTRETCEEVAENAWSCTINGHCGNSDFCIDGIWKPPPAEGNLAECNWYRRFGQDGPDCLIKGPEGFTINSFTNNTNNTNNTNTIHQKGHVLLLLFAILMYFMLRK